jgi:SAM-dependent MidA family methyltransferase
VGVPRPKRLVIYEFGGGYGTNARCILDFIRAMAPDLYRHMKYTIVEISR